MRTFVKNKIITPSKIKYETSLNANIPTLRALPDDTKKIYEKGYKNTTYLLMKNIHLGT